MFHAVLVINDAVEARKVDDPGRYRFAWPHGAWARYDLVTGKLQEASVPADQTVEGVRVSWVVPGRVDLEHAERLCSR